VISALQGQENLNLLQNVPTGDVSLEGIWKSSGQRPMQEQSTTPLCQHRGASIGALFNDMLRCSCQIACSSYASVCESSAVIYPRSKFLKHLCNTVSPSSLIWSDLPVFHFRFYPHVEPVSLGEIIFSIYRVLRTFAVSISPERREFSRVC
jgi:hypothetical protein